jgi:hypothetical protein
MGVNPPYDFQAVLRIWQQILRPILQRRPVEASEVVGGYARIHSGAMAPFHEAAQRYRVSLEELIEAYGDTVHGRRPVAAVEDLAAELASQMATDSGREMGSLLKMQSTLTDPHFVRNTLRSMDEILRAARVLSRKAFLPIVVVVSVQPAVADEAYVAGEYLYHDDHFIVLRATFSSVTLFARVMQAHRGEIGILVFETTSESLRRELVQRKDEWLGIEKVVWRNIPAANYHYLFAVLYQAAASISARTALIFGASADRLVNLSVPGLTQLELYCMGSSAEVLSKVDIIPVQPDLWGARSAEGQRPSFDIAVLVAPISSLELDAILAQMPPTGVVLDCLNQAVYHTAILHKSPQRIVPVSLWRSISGELLNLLDSEVCRIGEIPVHAVAAEPGTAPEEKLHESRAA